METLEEHQRAMEALRQRIAQLGEEVERTKRILAEAEAEAEAEAIQDGIRCYREEERRQHEERRWLR